MIGTGHDLAQTVRLFRARPALAATALLTLGLGVGAATAIVSALRALLFRPLPVAEASRVVTGVSLREGFDPFGTSFVEYDAYRGSAAFAAVALTTSRSFNVDTTSEPERLTGAGVSSSYFGVLGVEPVAGRVFTPDEDRPGGPAVALISYGLWQRRFGATRELATAHLRLDGRDWKVVGVLPRGFDLPLACDVWTPLQIDPAALSPREQASHAHILTARLRPGATLAQANADIASRADRLAVERADILRGWSYRVMPLRQFLLGDLDGRIARALGALSASVGLLLLIACANVANLLMALHVTRGREFALRLALGASRARIVRQILTESLALGLAGGALGLGIAAWIGPAMASLNPIQVDALSAFLTDFHVDFDSALAATALALASSAMVGGIAAARTLRSLDLRAAMAEDDRTIGGRSRQRWLSVLVAAELAIATTLLLGGGLLVTSFEGLLHVDLGFRPDGVVAMEIPLPANAYAAHEARTALIERILDRVRPLSGVAAAGISTNIPVQALSFDSGYEVEGQPSPNPNDVPITAHRLVSAGYLEALGVALVRGRLLLASDRADSLPVVVVSEALARAAWPDANPIGRRVRRRIGGAAPQPWLTVVGVVRDVKEDRYNFRINRPVWYLPYAQHATPLIPDPPLNLIVRAAPQVEPTSLVPALVAAVRQVDPAQPVANVKTMANEVGSILVTERFSAVLVASLAGFGLALAGIGLYGVLAFSVRQRTREIGLRLALGASARDIFSLIVASAGRVIVAGLALGLVGARLFGGWLGAVLFRASPSDGRLLAMVAVTLLAVAAVACYVPARRATRVDPLRALKG